MPKKVTKALFPVAGLGTRFLPATKALPKEMLPLVDKPLVQYALEEARDAGIEQFIFVTGRGKSSIEDHFDQAFELEAMLTQRGKEKDIHLISMNLQPGSILYTRQQVPLGLGHAVWCARHLIDDEPFAVLLADDFISSDKPCLKQMLEDYTDGNMVAVMDVPSEHVSRYGILKIQEESGKLIQASGIVEKPSIEESPSRCAVIGRYILDSKVMNVLSQHNFGSGGEIQLTDAISDMLMRGIAPLRGLRFDGKRYDCGSKAGFMAASVRIGMRDREIADAITQEVNLFLNQDQNKVA